MTAVALTVLQGTGVRQVFGTLTSWNANAKMSERLAGFVDILWTLPFHGRVAALESGGFGKSGLSVYLSPRRRGDLPRGEPGVYLLLPRQESF